MSFVQEMIQSLPLPNAVTLPGRAETLGRGAQRASFDRVTLRAVSSLPSVLELGLPLLKVGGVLLAMKGDLEEPELAAGRQAAAALGAEVSAVDRYLLPVLGDARSLVVVTKISETPARFPRREGVPAKTPLFWKAK
jgi:16S rRNA (guanine527-N7)-methyltransferase